MGRDRRWMPLFIGDYLADTAHLTATQSGVYLHLIMHYWLHGGLPDDPNELARICKVDPRTFAKMQSTLAAFFHDGWKHKRIEAELQRAQETSEKRSRAGVVGAAKRWQMPSRGNGRAIPHHISKPITSESVPRARKSRAKIKPSAELVSTVKRKGWRQ